MYLTNYSLQCIILVKWRVDLHNDFMPEYRDVQDELLAHLGLLEQFGPPTGTPARGHAERFASSEYEGIET